MKFFRHLSLILHHRHLVIRNAFHMGIFFHALKHDLSKFSPKEFFPSVHYFQGNRSPVVEERLENHYFSSICQHHTKRNAHHWEYWTDFLLGRVIAKRMPYKYATECVCDMLSASYTYNPNAFKPETTLLYFESRSPSYYMNKATEEYIRACLTRYRDSGWKHLHRKETKALYEEISARYPKVEIFETTRLLWELPPLEKKEGK